MSAASDPDPGPAPARAELSSGMSRSCQRLPRHMQRIKLQADQRRQRRTAAPQPGPDTQLATRGDVGESFSESSETESQQDVGLDFVGFKKTRDFGDFVTFSNSPSQL